ncbi:phage tail length tape measure family protein [Orbaceae bacterium ac157xtp]
MANNDMNIAMKFTADVNRAKDNISQLNAELKESASVAQNANKKSAQSYRDVYTAQVEAMNRGARAAAESEKQAKAQELVAKAAEAHKKEVDKLRNGLDQLLGSIDPAIKGLGRLDTLESKLRKSQKAGLIDSETFDNYLGKINNQRAALSTVDSLNAGTKKLSLNTRTAKRDMVSFMRQLSSGNFSAAGNSLFNIGNSTGKLPALFSAATLSVVAFVAAAYGVYKVISTILAEQERFNRALISTGNYSGTTASGLETMSKSVGSINHNYAETRAVIAELAESGQLSADSINNIASASAYMSAVTGKSAKESIASFKGIQESVTNWALESNKQYHFMDLATYNRIAALEAQGKTEEAIAVATGKYADEMKKRAEEMKEQLNWLEAAWDRFKNGVSDLGESLKDELSLEFGLADLPKQIKALEKEKAQGGNLVLDVLVGWDDEKEQELQNLYAEQEKLNKKAALAHEESLIQNNAIIATKELTEYWKQNSTEAEKQALAVEKIRKQYEALWVTVDGRQSLELKGVTSVDGKTFQGGQYDKDVKAITDKGLKDYNRELEKSLSLEKEISNYSKIKFETTEGKYKNASDAEKKRALELAKQLDAKKQQEKAEKQTATNDKTNLDLQKQLNQLLAGSKTSDETVDQWYNNLLVQFKKTGNQKGIDLIDQLLPLKKADAQLNEITTKIQQAKTKQSIAEQSIQAQVTGGLITQVEAQSQLVELHKTTAKELSNYLPMLEKMATMPGQVGELGRKAVAQLKLEVAELNKTTDALTNAMRNGLQNGIQDAPEGLAKGTYDLSEALTSLAQSIANSMAQIASQGLAELTMNGLDSLFSSEETKVAEDPSDKIKTSIDEGTKNLTTSLDLTFDQAAIKIANAINSSTLSSAPLVKGSTGVQPTSNVSSSTNVTGKAANTMGDAMTSAAASGAASMSNAIISASLTGSGDFSSSMTMVFSSFISSLISAMASNAMSSAATSAVAMAATGGYISGPGTSTSDSIPARLSDGEYVVKAAAVKKYGVDYLHAINTGRLHHYATGGLTSNVSTPSAPKLSDSNQNGTAQNKVTPVIQQNLILDSGEMITAGINSMAGSRSLMTWIRANKPTLKQELA